MTLRYRPVKFCRISIGCDSFIFIKKFEYYFWKQKGRKLTIELYKKNNLVLVRIIWENMTDLIPMSCKHHN